MRLKRLGIMGPALVLSVASLSALMLPQVADASPVTLYWCNVGGSNFNTASNWNTNSSCTGGTTEVPATGDNLVFDVTNLTSNAAVDDDMAGLQVGSITFQGTSTNGYLYTLESTAGNTLTVTGGISSSVSSGLSGTTLDLDLVVSGSQTFADTGEEMAFDSANPPTHTLTVNSGSTLTIPNAGAAGMFLPILSGGGTIDVTAVDGPVVVNGSSPNFTGTINVANNASLVAAADQALGGSSATTSIANGGSLGVSYTSDVTLPESITLNGTGFTWGGGSGAINANAPYGGGPGNSPSSPVAVTLSGAVTLGSDATIYTRANSNVTISGPLSGAFTLTSASGSGGTLTIDSSDNTSQTANSGSNTPAPNAPGTPDTGFALAAAHPAETLIGSLLAAGAIAYMAYLSNRKLVRASLKADDRK